MATTRKTNNISTAVSKAKTARIEAEQKNAENEQAHAAAQAHVASLYEALAGGDASVTSQALALAEQEVTRTRLLAGASSKALAEAADVEHKAVAAQAAEDLHQRLSPAMKEAAQAEARAALSAAIKTLVQAVDEDNEAIRGAIGDAFTAGLVDGKCDPLAPAIAGRQVLGFKRTRDYIVIQGTRYEEEPPAAVVEAVLRKVLDDAGVSLQFASK